MAGRSQRDGTGARRAPQQRAVASGTATLVWDGPRATLLLDGVESSCVDVDHPDRLEFEYMQQMTQVLHAWRPEPAPIRALHLGAAACALPWAWDTRRPGSRQVAVEVDADLAASVREWFALPRSPRLRLRTGDGREVLDGARADSYDVVVRDAFAHGTVPSSLATQGAARAAAAALRPGGLYLLNTAHGGPFDARPDIAAVSTVFPVVHAIADPKVGRAARRGNIVVAAQKPGRDGLVDGKLDADEVDRLLRRLPLPARAMRGRALARWLAGARPAQDPPAAG